jgi:hypothetical protein
MTTLAVGAKRVTGGVQLLRQEPDDLDSDSVQEQIQLAAACFTNRMATIAEV